MATAAAGGLVSGQLASSTAREPAIDSKMESYTPGARVGQLWKASPISLPFFSLCRQKSGSDYSWFLYIAGILSSVEHEQPMVAGIYIPVFELENNLVSTGSFVKRNVQFSEEKSVFIIVVVTVLTECYRLDIFWPHEKAQCWWFNSLQQHRKHNSPSSFQQGRRCTKLIW